MKAKHIVRTYLIAVGLIAVGLGSCTVPVNFRNPDKPKFFGSYAMENPAFDGVIKVVSYNIKLSEKIEQAIHDLGQIDELKEGITDPTVELVARVKKLLKHVASECEIDEQLVKPFLAKY